MQGYEYYNVHMQRKHTYIHRVDQIDRCHFTTLPALLLLDNNSPWSQHGRIPVVASPPSPTMHALFFGPKKLTF